MAAIYFSIGVIAGPGVQNNGGIIESLGHNVGNIEFRAIRTAVSQPISIKGFQGVLNLYGSTLKKRNFESNC